MPFNGIVDPEQLTILYDVLDDYCRESGIGPDHPERETIAHRLLALFNSGIGSAEALKQSLTDGRERSQA